MFGFGRGAEDAPPEELWQDRDIRFDTEPMYVDRVIASGLIGRHGAAVGVCGRQGKGPVSLLHWAAPPHPFDTNPRTPTRCSQLNLRRGEIAIDSINSVEDTKGNNGERGSLTVTNLRIMWQSHKHAGTNLSALLHGPNRGCRNLTTCPAHLPAIRPPAGVGYSTIQNLTIRTTQSKLRGTAQVRSCCTPVAAAVAGRGRC